MALSREDQNKYFKRLALSRLRILVNQGFYGLLLMHAKLRLDEECETAYTDGSCIAFSPKFMDDLSDSELDFIMMHEIMHIVLRHCFRYGKKDDDLFNIACDIVVNSNILKSWDMNFDRITLRKYGEAMHKAPDNREGYLYTAEEVYEMILIQQGLGGKEGDEGEDKGNGGSDGKCKGKSKNGSGGNDPQSNNQKSLDDHSKWDDQDPNNQGDEWLRRAIQAGEAIERRGDTSVGGGVPYYFERLFKELKASKLDWQSTLNDFVQEIVCDYSFSPPDRRFSDSPFFLPDFNGTEFEVSDILFMVDTSGSITNEMINIAYSEVKGALDQFDGKLQGWLGFFDTTVFEPIPFDSVENMLKIKALGGGGTSFNIIFKCVNEHMKDNPPKSIIIFTDGYAEFPPESAANNIPVLWLINNDKVTPPWGKVARVSVD